MGMEIWFSVFTHNRFNFVKGFCSKFKLFESKPPQVILCPSRLFHFLRFPFSFALMFYSKQSPPPPPTSLAPFFSATISFECHIYEYTDVGHCWFLSDLILFFLIRILFVLRETMMLNIMILKYYFFSSDNALIRQNSHWTPFLKIRPLIIIVFPFFFFAIFVSFSIINPCIFSSLLNRGGFLSWITFQGFLSQTDC